MGCTSHQISLHCRNFYRLITPSIFPLRPTRKPCNTAYNTFELFGAWQVIASPYLWTHVAKDMLNGSQIFDSPRKILLRSIGSFGIIGMIKRDFCYKHTVNRISVFTRNIFWFCLLLPRQYSPTILSTMPFYLFCYCREFERRSRCCPKIQPLSIYICQSSI